MKAFFIMLVVLTACSIADNKDYTFQDLNNQEFVEEIIQENQDLAEEVQKLKKENSIQEDHVEVLLEELKKLKAVPPSPDDKLEYAQVIFLKDKVTINMSNAFGAIFQDTKSMEPLINKDSLAIQVPPEDVEIKTGDIIAFKADFTEIIVVHRIIATGKDSEGWFAITKGDNNDDADPGKVREKDIIGVTIGIIY